MKTSIAISILLTVMLITVGYGVTSMITKNNASQAVSNDQLAAYYATREAQYQGLIAQANDTIDQANQELAALQGQTQPSATSVAYPVSADQALAIAQNAAGETASQPATLVNYSGTVAYEVVFAEGKVYIDANSGSVLYNGVAAARMITAQQAAQIAMNYTGNSQVVEVVSGYYNGVAAFRVTFQDGGIVYINAYGAVIGVQPASAPVTKNEPEEHDDD